MQFDGWHEELMAQNCLISDGYTSSHIIMIMVIHQTMSIKIDYIKVTKSHRRNMYDKEIYRRLCMYTAL